MESCCMNRTLKTVGYISIIPLLIGLYFFDNIRGYYRFKELCAEHKEVVVYQKLEPNVGWQANLKEYENFDSVNELLYFMPHIKFYRFNDYTKRQLFDASFIGTSRLSWVNGSRYIPDEASKQIKDKENYLYSLANKEIKAVYQLENFSEYLPNELRIGRGGYRIRDLRTNKVLVIIEDIGYGLFDQDKTILAAPSACLCKRRPNILSLEVQRQIFAK
jgi:hypothetical protein